MISVYYSHLVLEPAQRIICRGHRGDSSILVVVFGGCGFNVTMDDIADDDLCAFVDDQCGTTQGQW